MILEGINRAPSLKAPISDKCSFAYKQPTSTKALKGVSLSVTQGLEKMIGFRRGVLSDGGGANNAKDGARPLSTAWL